MSSTGKYVAALAVVLIVAAAAAVIVLDPFSGSDEDDDARYLYNYTYEDVDSITLINGTTVTKEEGGAEAIRVYTVAFKNTYSSPISFYIYPYSSGTKSNLVTMTTTITHPATGSADSVTHSVTGIKNFFTYSPSSSTSYYRTVYAGTETVFQAAFYLKDYSSEATDKSKITVDLVFDNNDIKNHGEKSSKVSVPGGAVLQYKTSPTMDSSTYTELSEIKLADGSTATADAGFCYRVYKIGMRSTEDACTIDPSQVRLVLSVTDRTSTTAGHIYDAVTNFIDTAPVSLDAWSGDEDTACKTMSVAFLVPKNKSTEASSISNTAYLLFDGHAAGLITNNSHVVVE